MMFLRRRLASCALVVMLLQLGLLGVGPLVACCGPDSAAAVAGDQSSKVECCPPGSHPPGQCPLHREARDKSRPAAAECRIRCDAPSGPGIVLGATGMMPPPPIASVSTISQALSPAPAPLPTNRPALPDAPPPKFL